MRRLALTLCTFGLTQLGWGGPIDFETAWERVLCNAPALAAAEAQVSSLQAQAAQVRMTLNPVFEVESENLGINKPSDEVEPPQTTFTLTQTIELGGKYAARYELANAESQAAYWDAHILRDDAYYGLMAAFVSLRTAHEKWELAEKRLGYAESRITVIKKQIVNGKVSPLQEKKARLEMLSQTLAVREAKSAYEQARRALAAWWGSSCPDFDSVDYELYIFTSPPCIDTLLAGFYHTSDYARARQEVALADKSLALQRANQIPDVTVMGGYRIFHDAEGRGGWVVGLAMPIPFFNRNQRGVQSAQYGLSQARYLCEEAERQGRGQLLNAYERLSASYEESVLLNRGILREAEESLDWTEKGYENGKIDYLELLEAKIMLIDIQEQYLDILCEYHLNRAELARLSGIHL